MSLRLGPRTWGVIVINQTQRCCIAAAIVLARWWIIFAVYAELHNLAHSTPHYSIIYKLH